MPIAVGCQCGKRFQAKDELAGKRVKCPGCGNVLTIPQPQPAGAPDSIDDLFGPASDPLFGGGAAMPAPLGGARPMAGAGAPARSRGKKQGANAVLIAGVAGGGVGLLLIVVVIVLLVTGRGKEVATNPPPTTPTPAPSNTSAPPPPTDTAPPIVLSTPPPPSTSPTTPTPSTTPDDDEEVDGPSNTPPSAVSSSSSSRRVPLGDALANWQLKVDDKTLGAIPVSEKDAEDEVLIYQYSWMTHLLPHLGYDSIYKKFDFKEPWRSNANHRAAQYRIPQFLNPGDDRQRWEGYQYPNMGLTHFVGMSGVENTRQEVAAKLDRSHPQAGIFGYRGVARETDITDGKNQTIMMIGSGELVGPWAVGGGGTIRGARAPHIDEATQKKTYDYFNAMDGFGSRGQPGPLTLFADGSARTLSPDMDPELFRAMCTMHGKDSVDLAKAGTPLDKLPTQDFDPMEKESEFIVIVVRRIGDGGDSGEGDGSEEGEEGTGSDSGSEDGN